MIEDTIDPMQCREYDLCWKRAKRQFNIKFPSQVQVYLQYKTCVSHPQYANQEFDIMLLLTEITPKGFTFYNTCPCYIQPVNFLRQYGISLNDKILSIDDIINQTYMYMLQRREQEAKSQLKVLMARNIPTRRWRL